MKNMDDKDYAVLNVLRKNAKLSTKQIAKKTGIPITTVHNRIKKLESSGIIKGYTTILDNKLIGNVIAFILISSPQNLHAFVSSTTLDWL